MASGRFVHLHTHSHYSLRDGVPSVEALATQAARLGFDALALTDHNTLGGIPSFTKACRKNGLKPIVGCEINILPFRTRIVSVAPGRASPQIYHATLLVKSEVGFRNLIKLVNRAHRNAIDGKPFITFANMKDTGRGLIFLTGCHRGELYNLLRMARIEETEEYIGCLIHLFGRNNVFFELSMVNSERERTINGRMVQLANFLEMGIVATNDVHFLLPEDEVAYACLCGRASILEAGAAHPFGEILKPPEYTRHLATPETMREKFGSCPAAIEATHEIADMCEFSFDDFRSPPIAHLPLHNFVRGQDADSYLWDIVFEEAAHRYGSLSPKLKTRLNEEFDVIKQNGLANHLVLLYRVATFLNENGIRKILSHSKLTSGIIAYLLGLSEVDPVKYHVRFRGFTGEGEAFPVATFEIPSRCVEKTVGYITGIFNSGSICKVGRYATWQRNTLLGHIARWARLSPADTDAFTKAATSRELLDQVAYEKFITENRQQLPLTSTEFLLAVYARLYPRPKNLQPHRGALAFCAKDLEDVLPCDVNDGISISQFGETIIDDLGLHRINIQPNPMLDILDTATDWVRLQGNPKFSPETIALNDNATYQLLGQGLTDGIASFSSITIKSLLRRARPTSLMEVLKARTEAEKDRSGASHSKADIVSEIATCLEGFRCAYIKAHYQASFMTAALTHAYSRSAEADRFSTLVRHTHRLGIKLKPPSVNVSIYTFSQEGDDIRTGLMVVRLMGEKACNELITVRQGGSFNDLADLCQRTDPRLINHRLLINLIKAGALDTFGFKRSRLLRILEQTIDSYRQSGEKDEATPLLFSSPRADFPEQIPHIPEFSPETLLRLESEATGYATMRNPLEPYIDLLNSMNAIKASELSLKYLGAEKFIAGFIEQIETEGPLVAGGTAMVLDFEGFPVKVSSEVANRYSDALRTNQAVLIGGVIENDGEYPAIRATCAFGLEDLRATIPAVKKIVLDCSASPNVDKDTLKKIYRLLKQYPGESTVEMINIPKGGARLLQKINKRKILFCPPLYFDLCKLLTEKGIRTYTPRPDKP